MKQFINWIILLFFLFIFSIPFLFMISNSFETFSYVLKYPPTIIPSSFNLDGYRHVLSMPLFPVAVVNSIVNTSITMIFAIFISTLSAYGFARIKFKGRELIFAIYLFTLMLPGFLNIIPQFIILKGLKIPFTDISLIGRRSGLILVYVSTCICGNTFFLRNFFRGIPKDLSESVIIDGGGHKTIFFKILLPLSTPAIGTMSIFAFQGFWEEYFTAKVLVGANEMMITLPLLLQRLNGEHSTRWEWVFAASILTLIPVVILFLVSQKKMVIGGLSSGSLKG